MLKSRGLGLPYIKTDFITDSITFLSLIFTAIILVFAVNYGDLLLLGGGLVQGFFTLAGLASKQLINVSPDKKETFKKASNFLPISIGAVAIYTIAVAAIPALVRVPLSASQVPLALVSLVSLVFLANQAVAEELFFRGAVTNGVLKASRSVILAILGSAGLFIVYHIPAENGSLINLGIIGVGGIALAAIDIYSRHLLPSIIAHITVNVLSVVVASILGVNLSAVMIHGVLRL